MRRRVSDGDGDGAGAQYARRGPGELEAEVLAALWAAQEPMTAGEVQRKLGDALAYTTVVTILSRLHAKGMLARQQHGRAYAYRPVADEPGLAARRMRQVLDSEVDRQQVLARFVSDLSDEDERLLRSLLSGQSGPGALVRPPAGGPGSS